MSAQEETYSDEPCMPGSKKEQCIRLMKISALAGVPPSHAYQTASMSCTRVISILGHVFLRRNAHAYRDGKIRPMNMWKRALGDSSWGLPWNMANEDRSPLQPGVSDGVNIKSGKDGPRVLLLPCSYLLPRRFVEPVVNVDHHFDALLWSFPSLPYERVVELLWTRVFPIRCSGVRGLSGGRTRSIARFERFMVDRACRCAF